jgi:hypothetical protein
VVAGRRAAHRQVDIRDRSDVLAVLRSAWGRPWSLVLSPRFVPGPQATSTSV